MTQTESKGLSPREYGMLIVLIATIIIAVSVVLTFTTKVRNVGRISTIGLGLYSDSICTLNLTEIDWGTLSPGESAIAPCYAKNLGSTNINLTMIVGNWSSVEASNHLTLNWNYTNGKTLYPGDIYALQFRLDVSVDIHNVTSFSFDVTVTANKIQ